MSLDERNAEFWDELCGTSLARSIGITGHAPDDLARFDRAYLDFYPYLSDYLPAGDLTGQRVVEIGLGFGTLGGVIVRRGATYVGVDVAPGPATMMRHRLAAERRGGGVVRGSALALPAATGSIDLVYSIGCLHHTGDIQRGVSEIRRVLRPGGSAVVMLYNRRWLRRLSLRLVGRDPDQHLRAAYDRDSAGRAAPHTDFVSPSEVRRLFRDFRHVSIDHRNLMSRRFIPRRWLLATRLDRVAGVNLYVRATA